ncbi:uncharacterized protein LOC141907612 isoform X2 [Tubulanus polymorphus]|uniref:uncharacterized protein LOC141907612 isoform X2 n=1 Tax=Tubulanus polymorphus TaxID=672921 RepID=UPI003DA248F1
MATKIDQNSGPLILQHDDAPRDIGRFSPTREEILKEQSYRFKGYPKENFMHPHEPLVKSLQDQDTSNFHYGKPSHFDKRKPQIDEGHQGVQYGENIPQTEQIPKPMTGAIPPVQKTSAELRKLRHQHYSAELDIEAHKLEKLRRMEEMQKEKKKDLDMLQRYNPWGKPGGGAPKTFTDEQVDSNNRKQKFREEDIKVTNQKSLPEFHQQFGKPGAGAPLRSESGKIVTEVHGDPLIRMHIGQNEQIKANIGNAVRYSSDKLASDQYAKALENQLVERATHEQEARIEELKKEIETLRHDPYGKPGAGAPNRSQSGSPKGLKNIDVKDGFKWGEGACQPQRDTEGNIHRHTFTKSLQHGIPEFTDSSINGLSLDIGKGSGGGAPVKTESGSIKVKLPTTIEADRFGQKIVTEKSRNGGHGYFPFGRPGYGAPLTDRSGNLQTTVHGKSTIERDEREEMKKARAAQQYLDELQREASEHRKIMEKDEAYRKAPVGELARVLNDGLVGKPKRDPRTGNLLPQHMTATDVTKLRTDERKVKTEFSQDYHDDLQRAAEERFRLRQLEKLKERQEMKHHQVVFDNFWDRPGGGAPNTKGTRRHDPTQIIHSPRKEKDRPNWFTSKDLSVLIKQNSDYVKNFDGGDASSPRTKNRYVRTTIPSHHDNQFEYVIADKANQRKDYDLMTPWAVDS